MTARADGAGLRADALVVLAILGTLALLGDLPAIWTAVGQALLGWRS
jgi:hypothetical protein